MPQIPNSLNNWIGTIVVAICLYVGKWYITKSLDAQYKKITENNLDGRKEREKDSLLMLKGQKVIAESLHETMYCVIHNEHNGGLEQCNQDLEKYRKDVEERIMEKAVQWDLNRDER